MIGIVTIITAHGESSSRLRHTRQRSLILEELRACASEARHPGAEEVFVRVRKHLPRISLATVYRNLELLADIGLIGRLEVADGRRRYDGMTRPHCHFRCRACGAVEDLPFDVEIPDLDPSHPWVRARSIEGGRPEYYGLCPECAGSAREALQEGRTGRSPAGRPRAAENRMGVSRPEDRTSITGAPS